MFGHVDGRQGEQLHMDESQHVVWHSATEWDGAATAWCTVSGDELLRLRRAVSAWTPGGGGASDASRRAGSDSGGDSESLVVRLEATFRVSWDP